MLDTAGTSAEARARSEFERVQDDPDARLQFARRFYLAGHDGRVHNFGTSELAFMKWEAARGVLNPADAATRPGSPWWREVNGGLLVDAQEAFIRHQRGDVAGAGAGAAAWLQFLRDPNAASWYRAHNTSIVLGYLAHDDLARAEDGWEQKLMNIVLYRVLFTQAVVDHQPWAFGFLTDWASGFFDPRSLLVDRVIKQRSLYPDSYPLNEDDRSRLERRFNHFDNLVVSVIDLAFIRARLDRLYDFMAEDLEVDALEQLCHRRLPSYPWSLHLHANEVTAIGVTDHPSWITRTIGALMEYFDA